jgi:mRNA interferase RelE/StbE
MEAQSRPLTGYRIVLRPTAERFFKKLRDEALGLRLETAITQLSTQPRPPGAKLLSGADRIWRIRIGHYRILYPIDDVERLIRVAEIGHRREIYR